MASVLTQVVDAVIASLKAGVSASAFATEFEPTKTFDPTIKLESTEADRLRVDVIPATETLEDMAKGVRAWTPSLDVAVRKLFGSAAKSNGKPIPDEVDALIQLTEEIAYYLWLPANRRVLTTSTISAVLSEPRIVTPYDPAHLIQLSQFVGVIRLEYRVGQ